MKAVHVLRRECGLSVNTINVCCQKKTAKVQVRYSATIGSLRNKSFLPVAVKVRQQIRQLGLGPTSKDFEDSNPQITGPLTKVHATTLVLRLNDEERKALGDALKEYESQQIKEQFEEMLAGQRWRSKLGRPSKIPSLGDVDPTGTYCPVPEDWLKKKYASKVPKPTTRELLHLLLANSIPFIGFGFLDNFIMIIAGDRIESSMSAFITISTMAAAALGNTFSDVIGIGSSYYVERAAALVGLGAPKLSPVQLEMPVTRRYANLGRVVGITLGCFLGMTPLLFKDEEKKPEDQPSPSNKPSPSLTAAAQIEVQPTTHQL